LLELHFDFKTRVIFSTTQPWDIDLTLKRRFETRIYVHPPNASERTTFIKQTLASLSQNITLDPLIHCIQVTDGYSFADLTKVVDIIKQCFDGTKITMDTLLEIVPPNNEMSRYVQWTEEYGDPRFLPK
jgi:SpoVK/Ycf46/Vps4 family AAA+-type ATPase